MITQDHKTTAFVQNETSYLTIFKVAPIWPPILPEVTSNNFNYYYREYYTGMYNVFTITSNKCNINDQVKTENPKTGMYNVFTREANRESRATWSTVV